MESQFKATATRWLQDGSRKEIEAEIKFELQSAGYSVVSTLLLSKAYENARRPLGAIWNDWCALGQSAARDEDK